MKTSTLLMRTTTAAFLIAGAIGATLWTHDSLAQGPFAGIHGTSHAAGHLAQVTAQIKAAANTTPEQNARIDALVTQASGDLKTLHAQAAQYHQQLHTVLTQDRIDRAALESDRLAMMGVADQVSRRLIQLMGDVAEVLTPEQRRAVVAHMQGMHAAH